jgi:hypothetical protein
MKDHPEVETTPKLKELCKAGYRKTAKTIALKEIQAERRKA